VEVAPATHRQKFGELEDVVGGADTTQVI